MEPLTPAEFINYNSHADKIFEIITKSSRVQSDYLHGNRWYKDNEYDRMIYRKYYEQTSWTIDEIEFEEKPKKLKVKRNKGGLQLETE